jgi:hypothetical protein
MGMKKISNHNSVPAGGPPVREDILTFLVVGLIVLILLMLVAAGLVRLLARPSSGVRDQVRAVSPSPTPESVSADAVRLEAVRARIAMGGMNEALAALAQDRSPQTLDVLLSLLRLPGAAVQRRGEILKLLAAWPDSHGRIAETFALILPEAHVSEARVMCGALAEWESREQAVPLARDLAHARENVEPLAQALARLAGPECVALLLEALPPAEPGSKESAAAEDPRVWELKRYEAIIGVLGEIRDPRAIPALLGHFRGGLEPGRSGSLSGRLWESACQALGKIGTDPVVAAMEASLEAETQPQRKAWLRQKLLPGLMRARHAKGRAAIEEVLAGSDTDLRYEAVRALAETATAADAERVLRVVAGPNPLFTQKLLESVPRLLPESRAAVEQACDRALDSRRFRSALALAEALADGGRAGRARAELDRLRSEVFGKPRLDQWLGRKKAPLQAEFPAGKLTEGDLALVEMGGRYHRLWTFRVPDRGLEFTTDIFGDGPCQRVNAGPGYRDPVCGVRLGDPASLAWELHGPTRATHESLWYDLQTPEGRQLKLSYEFHENVITRAAVSTTDQ